MKKIFLLIVMAGFLSSCTTTFKTARTESVPYSMYNATVADLDVSPKRVTHTMTPSRAVRAGGVENCKQAALQEALTKHGNSDLMVEPQFVIEMEKYLFRSKVTSVTVSGHPAKYVNFRSMPDSGWCKPVFRHAEEKKSSNSFFSVLKRKK